MNDRVELTTMIYERDADGVAIVTIDVPDRAVNVLTPELHRDVGTIAETLAGDSAARGAVIRSGKPSSFVAGGDLKRLVRAYDLGRSPQQAYRESRTFTESLRRLETCGKPVAAAINASALGGGLELALACHYRVVADAPDIRLGLPETGIGLIPGAGGTQRLPRLIGIERALELILEAQQFDPGRALELGIVDAVVPPDRLLETARRWILEAGRAEQPWDRKGFRIPGGAGLADARIARLFQLRTAHVAARTHHNEPAPIAALRAVFRGTSVDSFDAALRIETREFAALTRDPVARNIIRTMFLHKGRADRLAARPADVAAAPIQRALVLGRGAIAAGVAETLRSAELETEQIDSLAGTATAATDAVIVAAEGETTVDVSAVAPGTLVAVASPGVALADLAARLESARSLLGFYLPAAVPEPRAVEIVVLDDTADDTLARAMELARRLHRTPTLQRAAARPLGHALAGAYVAEGLTMLAEGVTPALIEHAGVHAGMAHGPLATAEALSLAVVHASLDADTGAAREVCEWMIGRGRNGFYETAADGTKRLWRGMHERFPARAEQPPVDEVRKRLLAIQALAAARAWEAGVVEPADADLISVLRCGFPVWTGGALSYIDTLGVRAFVDGCERLAMRHGARFAPSSWLRARAGEDDRVYPPAA